MTTNRYWSEFTRQPMHMSLNNFGASNLDVFHAPLNSSNEVKRSWLATKDDTSTNVTTDTDFEPLRTIASSSDVHAFDAAAFLNLYRVIGRMAELPEGADQAIDEETRVEAERMLGFFDLYDIPPPQVFSHGGDAVVFTWENQLICRYATVSGDEVGVLDVHSKSRAECPYPQLKFQSRELDNFLGNFTRARLTHNAVK